MRAKRAKNFGLFWSLLAVLQGKIDQKGVQKKYNFYNPPANNWPKKFQNNITPFQHLADLIVKGGGFNFITPVVFAISSKKLDFTLKGISSLCNFF